jgi:hypothetical protein
LFQAQNKDKEVTVEVLKKYLLETANLPENQIKIATGEQKELDGVDIFNRNEPTRYIITVEALKEGWDCSFAYVLCSLANIKSDTSVEQLLGRIMRMPYARKRKIAALNKAYAYVVSSHFGEAAAALTEKLVNKGFDDEEAQAALQNETPPQNELFDNMDGQKIDLSKTRDAAPSPASQGITFSAPRLMFEIPGAQGEFTFADPDIIFEQFDWDIGKYAAPRLEAHEFNIEKSPGHGFFIDLDGNRLNDGGEGGEEFQCAQAIDAESEVKFWLRNVARHHASFRLPTSTDNFYPDFVALLNDGRIVFRNDVYHGESSNLIYSLFTPILSR